MAHRLLPFRQYDENDVVNLFALRCDSVQLLTTKPGVDGINADGVLVKVEAGNMTENDAVDVSKNDSTFMNQYSSPVGRNPYPTNPLKLTVATTGSQTLGVTLNQTLAIDENNEQLLYNPVKKDELQAVLSGQTVPVLTKGLITISENAVHPENTAPKSNALSIGSKLAAKDGQFIEAAVADKNPIGSVLATGHRGLSHNEPVYGVNQPDFQSGNYYLIKLNC